MMTIGKPFNQLTKEQYGFYIGNHHQVADFNTLGLYRSLLENELLSDADKIEIRDIAHSYFQKQFDFLQLKDPWTFMRVSTIGMELTIADERQWWQNMRAYQQKVIEEKKFGHRNFGEYAKHSCGYSDCPLNGLMVRKGSPMAEASMRFHTDKNRNEAKMKALHQKKDRKNAGNFIRKMRETDRDVLGENDDL